MEEVVNSIGMKFVKIPGKDYYMGKYTVTQKQWKDVMRTMPWRGKAYVKEGDDYPATYISWNDCQEFVMKLNQKEEVDKYRFPTENEWEHACRAGSTTKYCFGNDKKRLKDHAWYRENARDAGEKHAHKVGQKKPNKWGLYDMHGNVWEWCEDKSGSNCVFRGGSWSSDADGCRSALRYHLDPDYRLNNLGLRLVRESSR